MKYESLGHSSKTFMQKTFTRGASGAPRSLEYINKTSGKGRIFKTSGNIAVGWKDIGSL